MRHILVEKRMATWRGYNLMRMDAYGTRPIHTHDDANTSFVAIAMHNYLHQAMQVQFLLATVEFVLLMTASIAAISSIYNTVHVVCDGNAFYFVCLLSKACMGHGILISGI